jgi:hypothetical protein
MEKTNSFQNDVTLCFNFEKDSQYASKNKEDDAYQFVYKGLLDLVTNHYCSEFNNICIQGQIEDIAAYISFYVTLYNQKHKIEVNITDEDFEKIDEAVLPD